LAEIIPYNRIDRTEWSKLVRESATGTWFQSPEAYALFAALPELFEPFAIGIINENSKNIFSNQKSGDTAYELRGVCVGYVTKEKSVLRQWFTRRAIILGGPCLKDDATVEEVELLLKRVRELGSERVRELGRPIYIETRNFNDYSRWKEAFEEAGFAYRPHLNFHVDCRDKETMWDRLSDNRKRQIRRGTSERMSELGNERMRGLEGERLEDAALQDATLQDASVTEQEIREWYGILEKLYRTKVKTPLWPVEFFLEANRQGVGMFRLVKLENKIIGGSFCVVLDKNKNTKNKVENTAGGTVYEWFECGLNAEYKEQHPSVMATWAGMEWAHAHGCARYDMMGAGEPGVPYGVRDFKSEFGGTMVEHGRFVSVEKPLLFRLGTYVVKRMKKIR